MCVYRCLDEAAQSIEMSNLVPLQHDVANCVLVLSRALVSFVIGFDGFGASTDSDAEHSLSGR